MRSFSLSPWIRGAQQEEKKRRREKGESMSYTALQLLLRNHQLSIKAWMTFTEVRTRKLKGNGSDLTKINDYCWGEPESQPTMGDAARVPALKRKIIMGKTPQMFLECWKRWRELGRGSSTFRQTFANFWTKNCCWIVCSLSLWLRSRRGSFHFYQTSPEPPAELSESTVADVKSFFSTVKNNSEYDRTIRIFSIYISGLFAHL